MVRAARWLLWPAGVAIGLVAEAHLYGWGDTRDWVPDAAVGWTMIACGLLGWSQRPRSRSGLLLAAAGAAWFAGDLSAQLVYLHRGPLVQLVLSHPSGRVGDRPRRAVIVLAYATAVLPSVARSGVATLVLAALVVGVAAHATAGRSQPRAKAFAPSVAFAALLAGIAVVRLASGTAAAASATLAAYQVGLGLLALGILADLMLTPADPELTDLVVELGDGGTNGVRAALASALGDPALEVGFAVAGAGSYVDGEGRPLVLPPPGATRRTTRIDRAGRPVAAIVHSPGVLDDPKLAQSIEAAARLASANAQLHADVQVQVVEVMASRRRLVRAADEQRSRLECGLRDGAEQRLERLGELLESARTEASDGAALERAKAQLGAALSDLHELAAGLHPRLLAAEGLRAAVTTVAALVPASVELDVPAERFSAELEAAAYFVCSEGLANVAKYAPGTTASIRVARDETALRVEVRDSGPGGADSNRGSGIRGLTDRVEALGGSLELVSPRGGGTRLSARLPL
jgi:signal transduction histidine kinase